MGNEQSVQDRADRDLLNSWGFRILNVVKDSLASEFGFESYFDYIVGINGHQIEDGNTELFSREIQNCAGRSVKFTVFSSKGHKLREVEVSLVSISEDTPVKLGFALQWAPLALSDIVFHVLNVQPKSPAYRAGLQPDADYIIGIQGHHLISEYALGEILDFNIGKDVTLIVYNHDYNIVRLTTITPEKNWGGEGILGCGIGFGYLHRIPEWKSGTPVPGEAIFSADEVDDGDAGVLGNEPNSSPLSDVNSGVPVTQTELLFRQMKFDESKDHPDATDSITNSLPIAPQKVHARRKHHHSTSVSAKDLDAYFDEQERISKAVDYNLSNSHQDGSQLAPPPPKDSQVRHEIVEEPEKNSSTSSEVKGDDQVKENDNEENQQ
ncbi:GRASP55/65 PDZ-like domain-containing protein [Lipomyces japonicus]|uniref:GRASP55/65 PDZ-like domain-containing protein n=1 Tax=Lipomyces japonicus TaxID=56871 RepID=UPI0034CEC6E4